MWCVMYENNTLTASTEIDSPYFPMFSDVCGGDDTRPGSSDTGLTYCCVPRWRMKVS